MPWPENVIRQFQTIPPNPTGCDFHGVYNKLLNTLFPLDTDFAVVPPYLEPGSKAADCIFAFEVFLENNPVFILELKNPAYLERISSRQLMRRLESEREI